MNQLFKDYPNKTILIYEGDTVVFTSEHKGVRPMMDYMKAYGPSETPLTVVDRIMGRGAVMLAVLINAKTIKTPIMSASALALAKAHNLNLEAGEIVPYIVNREGNGQCPIESSVLDIEDVHEGYEAIKAAIAKLMAANN